MDSPAVHALDADLFRQFTDQHAKNIGARRERDVKGAVASLIARSNFTALKSRQMSDRPGVDLFGVQKESKPRFIGRKVWSA